MTQLSILQNAALSVEQAEKNLRKATVREIPDELSRFEIALRSLITAGTVLQTTCSILGEGK
jgi:hypothetical protein